MAGKRGRLVDSSYSHYTQPPEWFNHPVKAHVVVVVVLLNSVNEKLSLGIMSRYRLLVCLFSVITHHQAIRLGAGREWQQEQNENNIRLYNVITVLMISQCEWQRKGINDDDVKSFRIKFPYESGIEWAER